MADDKRPKGARPPAPPTPTPRRRPAPRPKSPSKGGLPKRGAASTPAAAPPPLPSSVTSPSGGRPGASSSQSKPAPSKPAPSKPARPKPAPGRSKATAAARGGARKPSRGGRHAQADQAAAGGTRRGDQAPNAAPTKSPKAEAPTPPAAPLPAELQVAQPEGDDPIDPILARSFALVEELMEELTRDPAPARAARLHFEVARQCASPLGQLSAATAHYVAAAQLDPDHLPSTRGARLGLLALGRTEEALGWFDRELGLTGAPSVRAALLLGRADLTRRLGRPLSEAREALEAALTLAPADVSLLRALASVERADERWEALGELEGRLADAVRDEPMHRAALLKDRARIDEVHLGRREAAVERYEAALEAHPHAPDTLQALKRLHRAGKRWSDLIRVLRQEADKVAHPGSRAALLHRVARIYQSHLGRPSDGVAALEEARQVAPDDDVVLRALARAYAGEGRFEDQLHVLKRLAELTAEPADRVALLHRVGLVLEERLGAREQAGYWYRQALDRDPTHVPSLRGLSGILEDEGRWQELADVLLDEAEAAEAPARRVAAHARAAELLEVRLRRPAEAIAQHLRVLALDPAHAGSFKALARLYAAAGRYRELVALHEQRAERLPAEDAIPDLFRVGALYEDHLDDSLQAARTYERILAITPGDLQALRALGRAHARGERWEELLAVLDREVALTGDATRRAELLHRAGVVAAEHLGRPQVAKERFEAALELDGAHAASLAGLGRLAYRAKRWDELLDVYERELATHPGGRPAAERLHKMGEVARDHLGDAARARGYFERAVEARPQAEASLRALAELLEAGEDWEGLAAVLAAQRDVAEDAHERALLSYRLGLLADERLGEPDRALVELERAAAEEAGAGPAPDALNRLRVEYERWEPLVAGLSRLAAGTDDLVRRVGALMQTGEVCRDRLRDDARATAAFEDVLALAPGHVGALLALEVIYERSEAQEGLRRVQGALAQALHTPGARVAVLRHVAQSAEDQGEAAVATRALREILSTAQGDPGALDGLELAALRGGALGAVGEVAAMRASVLAPGPARSEALLRVAESLEAEGSEHTLDAYRGALQADPGSFAAAHGLLRVADQAGVSEGVLTALRHLARLQVVPNKAAAYWVRSAVVRTQAGADPEGAVADLERALDVDPDDAPAAELLAELLSAQGDVARLVDRLAAAASRAADRKVPLWLEVARFQAVRQGDLVGSLASLERVFEVDPVNVSGHELAAEVLISDRQFARSEPHLVAVVEHASEEGARLDAQLSLAEILHEHLDRLDDAEEVLETILGRHPDSRAALERSLAVQTARGEVEHAVEVAHRLLDVLADEDEEAAAYVELGGLHERLEQRSQALTAYREAIARQGPGSEGAQQYLRLVEAGAPWEGYAAALDAHIARAQRAGAAAYLVLAAVARDNLADAARATAALRQGVQACPDHADLRLELALALDDSPEEALEHAVACATLDVTRAEAWREVARLFYGTRQRDESRVALAPVAALGVLTPDERQDLAARPPRPGHARPGAMGPDVLQRLDGDQVPGGADALALLGVLGEVAGRLHPVKLEVYGLTSRDRLGARATQPARAATDEIAAIFGVDDYDLFVHEGGQRGVQVGLGERPAVLVPEALLSGPRAGLVFQLGRAFGFLARGATAAACLPDRELRIFLAAAARTAIEGFGDGLTSSEFLDEQARRIARGVPRRDRRALEDAALAYAQAPSLDLPRWRAALDRAAVRAAMLVADDLAAALEVLAQADPALAHAPGEERVAHFAGHVRFWVSDEAMELRRRSGLFSRAL